MNLLDWSGFLERVDHNKALALELAEDLLKASEVRTGNLEAAFTSNDQKLVEQAAHALRGLLAPYGASLLLVALKAIEEKARARALTDQVLAPEIRQMVDKLRFEVSNEVVRLRSESGQA